MKQQCLCILDRVLFPFGTLCNALFTHCGLCPFLSGNKNVFLTCFSKNGLSSAPFHPPFLHLSQFPPHLSCLACLSRGCLSGSTPGTQSYSQVAEMPPHNSINLTHCGITPWCQRDKLNIMIRLRDINVAVTIHLFLGRYRASMVYILECIITLIYSRAWNLAFLYCTVAGI